MARFITCVVWSRARKLTIQPSELSEPCAGLLWIDQAGSSSHRERCKAQKRRRALQNYHLELRFALGHTVFLQVSAHANFENSAPAQSYSAKSHAYA